MKRTLLEVTVSETDEDRDFWATRQWARDNVEGIRKAEIIVVPWIDFRKDAEVLFPQGTTDFVRSLQEALPIVVGVDRSAYAEVALYANTKRLPAIFVTSLMLPALAGALGNILSEQVTGSQTAEFIEMRLIVENQGAPCISVEYKGPPGRAVDTLLDYIERCVPGPTATVGDNNVSEKTKSK
ncbi:hypothetical protein PhaeoP83_00721 [Phaeobacter inhibens]|uniref:Uncharacterized protein n=1 Tax=Phaeobacter inhibens TaxID=221822 RepID=A0A2I7JT43_9RHOB|nr:hypothetical protein [Phaeobacter inhibens]AUQ49029.1 hypothetical protein PhaeoP83_00721 [Phaeobacter inhibens]AUQ93529.1 hypothetical protein PhaeoP66_00714 [Phaeobacter inhibens]AUQ99991.1 hypothetical protein PhaeoP88_02648 [Phaeobacter inhibens]AUR18832.1 hypothetical protein PhaeoP80_00721 [Phaeobacter inhibens]